jgi:hypothetical protein
MIQNNHSDDSMRKRPPLSGMDHMSWWHSEADSEHQDLCTIAELPISYFIGLGRASHDFLMLPRYL